MVKLIAKRSILYRGRQYMPGDELPAADPGMVEAWLRANSAERVNVCATSNNTAENGQNAADEADLKEECVDIKKLKRMSKDDLVAIAKQKGVEIPEEATKAQIIELLAGEETGDPEETKNPEETDEEDAP